MGSTKRVVGLLTTLVVALVAAAPLAAEEAPCRQGYVALTFDDGPGQYTTAVLDELASRRVPATFFVIGRNVANLPSAIHRQVGEGHVTANHTHGHEDLTKQSDAGIRSTVQAAADAITAAGARAAPVVRPPYGATNSRVHGVLAGAGYTHILWTVDTRDWQAPPREEIERKAIEGLAPGAVILLHDGHPRARNTAPALPRIIDTAHERGFCFGVLDDHGQVVPSAPAMPAAAPPAPPEPEAPAEPEPEPPPPPPVCADAAAAPFADRGQIARAHQRNADCAYSWDILRGAQSGGQRYLWPRRGMRRDQLAALLARTLDAAGYVLPEAAGRGFADIEGSAHAGDIDRLAAAGIVRGTSPSTFAPDAVVRRDQAAAWLVRAARVATGEELPPPQDPVFDDLAGNPHRDDVEAAAAAGLVRGNPSGSYRPLGPVSRQQAATLAVNLLALLDATGVLPPPAPEPDPQPQCLDLVLACLPLG